MKRISTTNNKFNPNAPRRQPAGPNGSARSSLLYNTKDGGARNARSMQANREAVQASIFGGAQATLKDIEIPEWMSEKQRTIFRRALDQLLSLEYFHKTDVLTAELFCHEFVLYYEACETLMREGSVVVEEGKEGQIIRKPHPSVGIRARSLNSIKSYVKDFALTPVARKNFMKMTTPVQEPDKVNPEEEAWDVVLN